MRKAMWRAAVAVVLGGFVACVATKDHADDLKAPVKVGEGMWMQQSTDVPYWGCNVAWIEFRDWVVVIDSAFPRGAEAALANIKATTNGKPIKYVIVTHYHADHSFGNDVFAKAGATIIAHENAHKMFLERNPKIYKERQETSDAARKYALKAPDRMFSDEMVIENGGRRAEVKYFGHAHTSGCIWTWFPKERVLFSGDATVNGPFNYMGDSDSKSWIDVITKAQALKPRTVVPGHGVASDASLLETQKSYFVELRRQVGALVNQGKSLDEIKKTVDIPAWREWTGEKQMKEANIVEVHRQLTKK